MVTPKRQKPKTTYIRTFELVQNVTGFMEGDISNWPNNIQDAIYAALERLAQKVQLPLAIVLSYCDIDYGDTKEQDKPYVHVVASEIVAADSRFYNQGQEEIKRIVSEMMNNGETKH